MLKYFIVTLGCQMNKSDSERITTVLESAGYKKSPTPKGADLVVINFCSVRQIAVDKAMRKIQNLKGKRQKCNSKFKIIATGCILKADKEKIAPLVDYILSIKDLSTWPKILDVHSTSSLCSGEVSSRNSVLGSSRYPIFKGSQNRISGTLESLAYLKIKPNYQTFPKAFVPISFGCNNFCSYCVVPYARGKEIHRKEKEILDEIKGLIAKKYNHITLLGENVNSYPNFVCLLQKITAIKDNFKVNFMAANPHNFSNELIAEIAKNPKLEKYLHLPLQSGDNAILKKMKRPYTSGQYLKLIAKIKKRIPEVKIVTDIIVGFPGETKKAFQNTVNVLNKIGFYQAYISKYSPRPGTAAFHLKDTVPAEEKSQREQILIELTRPHSSARKQRGGVGTTKSKLIVILGPTASGKTDLAVKFAKKFNGEIVCADSRQVYKGMDIGTASHRADLSKHLGLPYVTHHLFNFRKPNKPLNVALYKKIAKKAIKDIQKRGKIPFLVGGTGLYIKAITDNLQFPRQKPSQKLRKELEQKTAPELFVIYKKLDPKGAKQIDKNNKRRLIRAIEVCEITGKPFWDQRQKTTPLFDVLQIGVNLPKAELEKRITKRVEKMFKLGLEKEVKVLVKKYGWTSVLQNTIGYQEFVGLTSSQNLSPEPLGGLTSELIKLHTIQFAKRQMTWFKKDKRISWVKTQAQAKKLTINFLN